jgi:RNA polymerase sigma factor (sigma-70 family)
MTTKAVETIEASDADLVAASIAGNREAFGHIVTRYQTLVCSLAYSGTGNLSQSEDLAQETFVAAWKQLAGLREPGKLRSWLCQIARNLTYDALKREGREPSHRAEPLEEAAESHSPEPLPVDNTISKEEAEILWRSLERIPEIYREPLVLFYREHKSIETVAADLDLSEDAVKQRLSRGRKLLQEQVLAFVEGALARTNPGQAFTANVLAALPALTISAKAVTLGTAAAKGSAATKAAGAMGLAGAILSPLLIVLGNYKSYRMSIDEAHSDEERQRIKAIFRDSLFITVVLSAALGVIVWKLFRPEVDLPMLAGILFSQFVAIYFLVILFFVVKTLPGRRRYLRNILVDQYGSNFPEAAYEFRSRASLFGLPLVHVRIGDRFDVLRGPVKAWIAVGSSYAVGLIFASGGIAIAPVSFGGIAIGLLPFGALAMGWFALGATAVGAWAYGGLAIGWQASGGVALAWNIANGGIAVAHDFAIGGIARAAHVADEAKTFVEQTLFFRVSDALSKYTVLVMLAWIVPMAVQSRLVERARRRREQANA